MFANMPLMHQHTPIRRLNPRAGLHHNLTMRGKHARVSADCGIELESAPSINYTLRRSVLSPARVVYRIGLLEITRKRERIWLWSSSEPSIYGYRTFIGRQVESGTKLCVLLIDQCRLFGVLHLYARLYTIDADEHDELCVGCATHARTH